jgi:hypothetical protein
MFIQIVHNGSPSWCTPLEEFSNENGATSSARGSLGSPDHRGCNVVTLMDPMNARSVPESTPDFQTIPTITVRMVVPQLGMTPLSYQ